MQFNHIKLLRLCYVLILGSMLLFTTSCDKDDDNDSEEPDNEQELITTVSLTFTAGGSVIEAFAADLDGTGGNPPIIRPITLKANTNYVLIVRFSDESKTPSVNLTAEVKKESNEHLICFATTGSSLPIPTIQDKDENGQNLGLLSNFTTGAAGTGTLKVTLKHKPNKSDANPCATGETDVEQTFQVTIAP